MRQTERRSDGVTEGEGGREGDSRTAAADAPSITRLLLAPVRFC
eukprot:COSAG03_NODE_28071_length_232_cov_12.105263_1_plen_43_part_01